MFPASNLKNWWTIKFTSDSVQFLCCCIVLQIKCVVLKHRFNYYEVNITALSYTYYLKHGFMFDKNQQLWKLKVA